jgi:hypothetical protein
MRTYFLRLTLATALAISLAHTTDVAAMGPQGEKTDKHNLGEDQSVQLGPRPFYLVDKMSPGPLKDALQQCSDNSFEQTDFSIGHRGGGTL